MRNRAFIASCLLLAAVMLLPLAACSSQPRELAAQLTILTWLETENGVMEYSTADVPFPEETKNIKLIGIRGEKLYFCVADSVNEETGVFEECRFIRTDMDGGNITTMHFNIGDWFKQYDEHGGDIFVPYGVTVDLAGNLIAVAHEIEDGVILPDATVYRLDAAGNISQTIGVGNADMIDTTNAKFDAEGNMYLRRFGQPEGIVTIVEPDGYTYDLSVENASFGFSARMSDGRVAFVTQHTIGSVLGFTIRIIDAEKRDWGDSFVLEASVEDSDALYMNSRDGIGLYDLCFADYDNFYGYDIETGNIDVLLNWKENGISTDRLPSSIMIDGNSMAFIHYVSK